MLKSGPLAVVLPGLVLCATLGRIAAGQPDKPAKFSKPHRAVAFKLPKDRPLPEGIVNGSAVDIVAEINQPTKTGIAVLNVELLAIGVKEPGEEQGVTVMLTPAQEEVLDLMQKHGMKLGIKMHGVKKREEKVKKKQD
jgi:hypothetical protein